MTVCNGRGGNGSHCCYIRGQVCGFLTEVEGQPRCGLLLDLGSWEAVHSDPRWRDAPVGQWFAEEHPGFGCGDWPQSIPSVMEKGVGLCCWQEEK